MTHRAETIRKAMAVAKRAKGGVVKEARPAGAVRRSEARGEPAPLPPTTREGQPLRPLRSGESRSNPDGSRSTELLVTVPSEGGQWRNVPSLWMGDAGPVEMPNDDMAGRLADGYERATSMRFPRYPDITQAEAAARSRSEAGGASRDPLALPVPRPNPARSRPAPANPAPRGANSKTSKTVAPPSRMRDVNPMPVPRPKPVIRTPRDADLGLADDIRDAKGPSQGARSGPPIRRMPVFERSTRAPSLGSRFNPEPPRREGPSLGERFTRSDGPRPGDPARGGNSPLASGISGYREEDLAGTPRFELAGQPSLTTPGMVPDDFVSAVFSGRTLTPEQRGRQVLRQEMSGPRAPVPVPNPRRIQLQGRMEDAFMSEEDMLILEALKRARAIRGGG